MSSIDPREPIHHVVRAAEFTEEVELIDIHLTGGDFVLLRSRRMPEFAFMLWTTRKTSTLSQLSFRYRGGRRSFDYSVVCACCSPEVNNLDNPEAKKGEFAKIEAMKFREALLRACRQNFITTVFMRNAASWDEKYGRYHTGISFVEANEHWGAYSELYERRVAEDALQFIHPYSRHLGTG